MMENAVNIKINGFDYQVPAGSTILEAAHMEIGRAHV